MKLPCSRQGRYAQNLPLFDWADKQPNTDKMRSRYGKKASRWGVSLGMAAAIANNMPIARDA